MASRVGRLALAMCGVKTTLGTSIRPGCTSGSPSNTSRPAAAMVRFFRATASAAQSRLDLREFFSPDGKLTAATLEQWRDEVVAYERQQLQSQ